MSHVEHADDVHYRNNADTALAAVHDTLKLGCKRPADSKANRLLRFESVFRVDELPPYLPSSNRRAMVTRPWDMLGNDQEGDCFFAGSGHTELLCSSVVGKPVMIDRAGALRAYHECTGPGDNGTDPIQGMKYWQNRGLASKIAGYVKVSPNEASIKHAIQLFGSVGIGVNLPAAWKGQTVWKGPTNARDLVGQWKPGSWDASGDAGHWFPLLDWDTDGFWALPWAATGFVKLTMQGVLDFNMVMLAPLVTLWLDEQGLSPELKLTMDWLKYEAAVLAGTTLPPKPQPPVPPPVSNHPVSFTIDGQTYAGSLPRIS